MLVHHARATVVGIRQAQRLPPVGRLRPSSHVQALPGGYAEGRAAVVSKLRSAHTLQEIQDIVNRYGDYLSPEEVQQLVMTVAPRLAQRQQQQQQQYPQPRTRAAPALPGYANRLAAAAAASDQRRAAAAAAQRQRQQEALQHQELMQQLARMTRRALPQYEEEEGAQTNLADTAYALAHAGALDEGLAQELLQHTARSAAAGKLGVQGLADVLAALGKARYRPSAPILRKLLSDVNPLERCTSAQELSALLSGLAGLGYRPDEAFVEEAMQRLRQRQQAGLNAFTQQPVEAEVVEEEEEERGAGAQPGVPAGMVGEQEEEEEVEEEEGEEEEGEEQRELEEARHVAGAVQALQRMGHTRQAAELKASYLQDLQARAAARMQQQQQQLRRQQQLSEQRETEAALRRQAAAAAAAEQEREEAARAAAAAAAADAAARGRMEDARAAVARASAAERLERKRQEEARAAAAAAAQAEQERLEKERVAAEAGRQRQPTVTMVGDAIRATRSWRQLRQLLFSLPAELLGGAELAVMIGRLPGLLSQGAGGVLTWRDRNELSQMLEQWGGLMTARVEQGAVGPGELTTTLQSLAALRWLDQQLLGVLLRDVRRQLTALEPAQLAAVLGALATAGLRPSTAWQDAFVNESLQRITGFSPSELLDTARSMTKIGMQPGAPWILAYLGALQAKEAELSPQQASACLQAAAALDGPLVQRWYAGLFDTRRTQQRQQQLQSPPSTSRAPPPALTSLSDDLLPEELSDPPSDTEKKEEEEARDQREGLQGQARQEAAPHAAATTPPAAAESPAQPPQASQPPQAPQASSQGAVESIEFDEEGAGGTGTGPQLPDTFLLDRLQPATAASTPSAPPPPPRQPSSSKPHKNSKQHGKHAATGKAGSGPASRAPQPPRPKPAPVPFTAAQLRSLRSALLERVELAEDTQERAQAAVDAAKVRAENAAIRVAAARGQLDALQADYERFKARHADSKLAMSQQVQLDVFKKLLPLLDNFERAAGALKPKTPGEEAIHTAYQALPTQIGDLLRSAGAEEVPGAGQPFDPAVHDAIMQEVDTTVPDGTVLQVLQRGYKAGDVLLRPALVKVSTM